jgi:hypothetical protein
MATPKCSVLARNNPATFEVRLYAVYLQGPETIIFDERDFTCPYLCAEHVDENERAAKGKREPLGIVECPFSNLHRAKGFTIYRPLTHK